MPSRDRGQTSVQGGVSAVRSCPLSEIEKRTAVLGEPFIEGVSH